MFQVRHTLGGWKAQSINYVRKIRANNKTEMRLFLYPVLIKQPINQIRLKPNWQCINNWHQVANNRMNKKTDPVRGEKLHREKETCAFKKEVVIKKAGITIIYNISDTCSVLNSSFYRFSTFTQNLASSGIFFSTSVFFSKNHVTRSELWVFFFDFSGFLQSALYL